MKRMNCGHIDGDGDKILYLQKFGKSSCLWIDYGHYYHQLLRDILTPDVLFD